MSITDELREYADKLNESAARKSEHGFSFIPMRLECIADRIDTEHERLMGEQYKSLTIDMQPMTDENMAESGWVRLPKDADGEVIHIGDVMDTEHFGTVEVEGFVHGAVAFYNYSGQPAYICTAPANTCHHHQEPTVEDVLRECCGKYHSLLIDDMNDAINRVERDYIAPSEIIDEYADRIREAVEHE